MYMSLCILYSPWKEEAWAAAMSLLPTVIRKEEEEEEEGCVYEDLYISCLAVYILCLPCSHGAGIVAFPMCGILPYTDNTEAHGTCSVQ